MASRKRASSSPSAPGEKAEDFRASITQTLVGMLEHVDLSTFRMPWHLAGTKFGQNNPLDPRNAVTGSRYNGINWFKLALASGLDQKGPKFSSARYATYRQWLSIGGQVRQGSRGLSVVKVGTFTKKGSSAAAPVTPAADIDAETTQGKYLKIYTVFAAEQVDGVEGAVPPPVLSDADRLAHVEAFVSKTKAEIRVGGDRAACLTQKLTDRRWIIMPPFEHFTTQEGYYSTLLHELIHWTELPTGRAASLVEAFPDTDERLAFEELTAELGAAMLTAHFSICNDPHPDHAAYLASWLAALRNDTSYIMKASAHAQKAMDYLLDLVDGESPAADDLVTETSEHDFSPAA